MVFKGQLPITDCYEVDEVEGRAWRIAQPATRCSCGGSANAYIDTKGPFEARSVGESGLLPETGPATPTSS